MGLLSKFGKRVASNFKGQFPAPGDDILSGGDRFSVRNYLQDGPMMNAMLFGAGPGALFGAAGTPPGGDYGDNAWQGAVKGAGIVGGAAAGIGGGIVAKRALVALAKAVMQMDP